MATIEQVEQHDRHTYHFAGYADDSPWHRFQRLAAEVGWETDETEDGQIVVRPFSHASVSVKTQGRMMMAEMAEPRSRAHETRAAYMRRIGEAAGVKIDTTAVEGR